MNASTDYSWTSVDFHKQSPGPIQNWHQCSGVPVSNDETIFTCIKWEKFRSTTGFIHKHIFWLKRIMPYDAIIITSNFRFLLHKPENEKIDTNYLSLQSKKNLFNCLHAILVGKTYTLLKNAWVSYAFLIILSIITKIHQKFVNKIVVKVG